MSRSSRAGKTDAYAAPLIGVAAAVLFWCYAFALFTPEVQFPKYPNAAALYVAGTLPSERIADFSPLYFYLHLLNVKFFSGSPFFISFLHVAAAALSCSLLFLLLRRHFGIALSLAGVCAFALNRSLALYTCIYEPEVFLVLFLLLFLWALDAGIREKELTAGFFLALCLLTRPNLLPMLAVVPLYLYLRNGEGWRRSTLLLLAFPLLALALLSWRNHSTGGGYSPVVMNPGFVFFEANNPLASGQSAVYPPLVAELRNEIQDEPDNPHKTYRVLARLEAGEELSTATVNRYWLARGMNFVADYPLRWLRLEARKFFVLWHEHRRHDLLPAFSFERILEQKRIPYLPFALVSSCALLGLLLRRNEWRRYLVYYALFAIQLASMLVFYVSDRQRLTLLPLFVLFACAGVSGVSILSGRRRAALLAGILLTAILFSVPGDKMRDDLHLWDSDERCNRLWRYAGEMRDTGNMPEAAHAYALSFAVSPWVEDYSRPDHVSYSPGGFAARAVELWPKLGRSGPSAVFDRGVLLLAAGKLDEAELVFRDLFAEGRHFDRGHLQSSRPEFYLGQIALRSGATARARQWFERALEATPGEPFALAQLAALTGSERYRTQLLRYFGRVETDWLLGRALLEQGKGVEAQEPLTRLNGGLPDFRRGMIYLAAANGAAGNALQGAELYLRATRERPAPLMLESPILNLFARLATTRPNDQLAHYRYGLVLGQFGYFRESLAELDLAYAIHPSEEIARELQLVREYLKCCEDRPGRS